MQVAGCSKCPNCTCAALNAMEAQRQAAMTGSVVGLGIGLQTTFSVTEVVLVLRALKAQYCGPNSVPVTGAEMLKQAIRTFEGME